MLQHGVSPTTTPAQTATPDDPARSAFLGKMSHDLRMPLNSIIGFTGILMKGLSGPLSREQSNQLAMVRDNARQLLSVINDLLELSQLEAGQLPVRVEPFSLRWSIERVVCQMRPLADRRGLALNAIVAPGVGDMWTDQRRVEQILLSLVDNAIKSTERGQVTIAADLAPAAEARNPRSPAASHRPADRGALVRLRVTDTGIGIAPEHLATVFEPFHQVDASLAREHERAGLSLAIARGVAELLGGEISVTSNWLKGSEFTVIIPIQIAV